MEQIDRVCPGRLVRGCSNDILRLLATKDLSQRLRDASICSGRD